MRKFTILALAAVLCSLFFVGNHTVHAATPGVTTHQVIPLDGFANDGNCNTAEPGQAGQAGSGIFYQYVHVDCPNVVGMFQLEEKPSNQLCYPNPSGYCNGVWHDWNIFSTCLYGGTQGDCPSTGWNSTCCNHNVWFRACDSFIIWFNDVDGDGDPSEVYSNFICGFQFYVS